MVVLLKVLISRSTEFREVYQRCDDRHKTKSIETEKTANKRLKIWSENEWMDGLYAVQSYRDYKCIVFVECMSVNVMLCLLVVRDVAARARIQNGFQNYEFLNSSVCRHIAEIIKAPGICWTRNIFWPPTRQLLHSLLHHPTTIRKLVKLILSFARWPHSTLWLDFFGLQAQLTQLVVFSFV